MREIKFRAFDEQYGMLSGDEIESLHEEIATGLSYGALYVARKADYENDWREFKVMQYTGLKDKNGVEIYEADILKGDFPEGINGLVEYDDERAQFIVINESWYEDWFVNLHWDVEVIGNIHENKELINHEKG